ISFLVISESMTGLAALSFSALITIGYLIIKSPKKLVKLSGIVIILFIVGFGIYVTRQLMRAGPENEAIDFSALESMSPHGNPYSHDLQSRLTENGHYIWIYVCHKELQESWNRKSSFSYSGKDLKGNNIVYTLVRFLASKGLRKDADGVNSLSNEEVKAIERGVVNANYQDLSSLEGRLHEIKWELDLYQATGDPNGHSITMRFEFWKAALGIVQDNPLIGVGTGDIKQAFEDQYVKMNSPLLPEWRLRSHNQYLSIAVAFGVLGLIWFLITLFYPMVLTNRTFDYLYITFLLVATISFLTEDTLETQAGVTFYAFFNSFFLFIPRKWKAD
ncbi:MAG TPA: O-antigen ligase family protein, partial [Bacteroidia bacterium]